MRTYTRRQFLRLTGIAIIGNQIGLPAIASVQDETVYQGRTLTALEVHQGPHIDSPIVTTLWPDSVIPIFDVQGEWYRVKKGYVARENVQPMLVYPPPQSIASSQSPFWGEVIAPIAPIRQYCSADAPLVTRIGHGGVAQIVDYLPGEPHGWYGIGNQNGQVAGWTQAIYWQAVDEVRIDQSTERSLEINITTQQVSVWENGNLILEAPCSTGWTLHRGIYTIQGRKPGGEQVQVEERGDSFHGVPWVVHLDQEQDLTGVYWHNRFGRQTDGPAIQVTPLLAHWLYGWLGDRSQIVVR